MNSALLVLRALILVVIIILLLYHFIPGVEIWCNERIQAMKHRYERMNHFLKDHDFDVPENRRRPTQAMREFYQYQDQSKLQNMIETRKKWDYQYHMGSVLLDGYDAFLPDGDKWEHGKIKKARTSRNVDGKSS